MGHVGRSSRSSPQWWRPLLGPARRPAPQPDRPGTVVVAVASPFTSLNGGTAQGRAPGSTLVRGLAQSGFVSLDGDGSAVLDPSFGTVEKVSDAPLTVKYTIAKDATWSDGVPVTADDLVLEWAARSGQLDDVAPELDAAGEVTNSDALAAGVAFAAASPALVYAEQPPVVDGAPSPHLRDAGGRLAGRARRRRARARGRPDRARGRGPRRSGERRDRRDHR